MDEIVGTKGDTCTMRYGKEAENPSAGPAPDKTCEVPTRLGTRRLKKGDAGIDFSSIGQYCRLEPGPEVRARDRRADAPAPEDERHFLPSG